MEFLELKKRTNLVFSDFWYDSSFSEVLNPYIKTSFDLIYPGERDTEETLIAKLFLLRTLALDYGYEQTAVAIDEIIEPVFEKATQEINEDHRQGFGDYSNSEEKFVIDLDED